MADISKDTHTPLGIYERPQLAGLGRYEAVALGLSVVWLCLSAAYFLLRSSETSLGGLRALMTVMTIFLPIAMIWVAAMSARTAHVMRAESARLQAAIENLRHIWLTQGEIQAGTGDTSVVQKLEEIAAATKKTESALATFQTSRVERATPAAAQAPAPEVEQPSLALGQGFEDAPTPLPHSELIRALNFPETAEDEEGFVALRKAMADRSVAQMVTAAQDILTLLSQDGIYMDDLQPDRARPDTWRQFAAGARGRTIAALGGVHDRTSLALSAGRMKQDPIFRDTAHHFLRRFDRLFSDFAQTATDEEIVRMSDTRTARAFMLLGRVAGTFD